ncbi:hypothetical protein [Loktanella sp. S4079]|uniref:hypothetical protein n=1 Tax=Loktanella sp. S4079 TaxID=579483 RepID=UPI000A8FF0B4|nr:hypothetical protein [Loktanella sp. S4079]
MTDHIWMCDAQRHTQFVRGFSADLDDGEPQVFSRQEKDDTFSKNDMGIPLARDRFPEKVYWRNKWKFDKSLPQFFHSGFIFINEKAANILRDHDLGQGALYPVDLFENDRVTPIEANILTLCIGNQKDTVLLDQSENMKRLWPRHDFFSPQLWVEDDNIVVDRSCLEGPDLWADPKIKFVFFMSDRLGQALIKARMKNAVKLVRCRVS